MFIYREQVRHLNYGGFCGLCDLNRKKKLWFVFTEFKFKLKNGWNVLFSSPSESEESPSNRMENMIEKHLL